MRKKRFILVMLALLLLLPTFFAHVTADERTSAEKNSTTLEKGKAAHKDEVVYANLSATGELENIYVVNIFDIVKEGNLIDYGSYSSVKNLTDLSTIEQKNEEVHFTADNQKFYYQGNMDDGQLPWNFKVSYLLNGQEKEPDDLAGESGQLQIKIETSRNEAVDPSFYENFLLQISLVLNTEKYNNIHAADATIANAGKNKQVAFTVMPEHDGEFLIKADVIDFEFDGIEIAAVPSSMSIDLPNTDDLTKDMDSLVDAISQLNDGVGKLKSGVRELNEGVESLKEGSEAYKDGMNEVDRASVELINASETIDGALQMMWASLNGSNTDEQVDLSQLGEVTGVLDQFSEGLFSISEQLSPLIEGYSQVLEQLSTEISNIPEIPLENLMEIQQAYENNESIQLLLQAYGASQRVKGTFEHESVQTVLQSISPVLEQVTQSLTEMGIGLAQISQGLAQSLDMKEMGEAMEQLKDGIGQLSNNYGQFHLGLVSYTDVISQLASSYEKLHSGLTDLSSGTEELENGVGELHKGTTELHEATKDMPAEIQKEMDELVSEFDKSDYKPISFVSPKNDQVNSVQFVIRTDSIKKEEVVVKEEVKEEKKGFWRLLLDLFR